MTENARRKKKKNTREKEAAFPNGASLRMGKTTPGHKQPKQVTATCPGSKAFPRSINGRVIAASTVRAANVKSHRLKTVYRYGRAVSELPDTGIFLRILRVKC